MDRISTPATTRVEAHTCTISMRMFFLSWRFLSFFLSWVSKTQPNHWTKRMANTQLATEDPRTCPGPEDWSFT